MYGAEKYHLFAIITGLLVKLAPGSFLGRVTALHESARDFERKAAYAVPVLSNQHDLVFRGKRNDIHPRRRFQNVEIISRTRTG
jgi:hypothetical protein